MNSLFIAGAQFVYQISRFKTTKLLTQVMLGEEIQV